MNDAGLALLKHYEGFSPTTYLDSGGVPTIGYGMTYGVKLGDTITQDEADKRLLSLLADYEKSVPPGTENQRAAMTCLCFNIGAPRFSTSSVKRLHLKGDFPGAANAFLLWDKCNNKVLPGLVKRRNAERTLYLTEDK